jgi:hypothetical protein
MSRYSRFLYERVVNGFYDVAKFPKSIREKSMVEYAASVLLLYLHTKATFHNGLFIGTSRPLQRRALTPLSHFARDIRVSKRSNDINAPPATKDSLNSTPVYDIATVCKHLSFFARTCESRIAETWYILCSGGC